MAGTMAGSLEGKVAIVTGTGRMQKPREVGISDSGQLHTDRRTNPIHVE